MFDFFLFQNGYYGNQFWNEVFLAANDPSHLFYALHQPALFILICFLWIFVLHPIDAAREIWLTLEEIPFEIVDHG